MTIGSAVKHALEEVFKESADIDNFGKRMQQDSYNCGPWIVEFMRSRIEQTRLSEHLDINQARAIQTAELAQVRAARAAQLSD